MSVLQRIRLEDEKVPILILSAKAEPDDRIKGLSCGVDDYLSKPFNLEEFLLRIERLLVRVSWSIKEENLKVKTDSSGDKIYAFGDNTIDFEKSSCIVQSRKNSSYGTGDQITETFYRKQGKTSFEKKAS